MDIGIKFVVFLIIFLFLTTHTYYADIPPEEPISPEPPLSESVKMIEASTVSSSAISNAALSQKPITYSGSGGSSSAEKNYYTTLTAESPIKIDRFTEPNFKEGVPLDAEAKMIVEIKNIGDKDINGLSICDRIDNNLDLLNEPKGYLTYFDNRSWGIINSLESNKSINKKYIYNVLAPVRNDDKTISINIDYLGAHGRVVYYYKVKTLKLGNFLVGSSVSFWDKQSREYENVWEYECLNTVKVTARSELDHVYRMPWDFGKGPQANIYYDFTYNNNKLPIEVGINKSLYYNINNIKLDGKDLVYKKTNEGIKFNLTSGEKCELQLDVECLGQNTHLVPSIFINGVSLPENIPVITVENYFTPRDYLLPFLFLIFVNILVLALTIFFQERNINRSLALFDNKMGNNISQIEKSTNAIIIEIKNINSSLNQIEGAMKDINHMGDNKLSALSQEIHLINGRLSDTNELQSKELRLLNDNLNQIQKDIKK